MNLSEYNGKYVRICDADGKDFSGRAKYGGTDLLECEWGVDEDGLIVDGRGYDKMIYELRMKTSRPKRRV